MTDIDDTDPDAKWICSACVREAFLSKETQSSGKHAVCSYCGAHGPAFGLEAIAERIEQAFDDHYTRTASEPDAWETHLEAGYGWTRKGMVLNEAIQLAAGIDEAPAIDVAEALEEKHAPWDEKDSFGEEAPFSSTAHYERRSPSFIGLHLSWHDFEQSLKTKARFFSRTAEDLLARVFGGIDKLRTKDGRDLVVEIGPGTRLEHLYRARVFQADDGLKDALCRPDLRLGSPPAKSARAGRMNAHGISVFYGALTPEVAVAEVRPPVGSRVVVARFEVVRRLRVLDLTALSDAHEEGSVFDPTFKDRLHRADFLRSLDTRMARPVMPDDEGIDYLPTQAVADFLATTNDPPLDGILFESVQADRGYNVVLFHGSAKVAPEKLPKGTEISARSGFGTEEESADGYFVEIAVPRQTEPTKEDNDPFGLFSDEDAFAIDDDRQDTLRVVLESVEVRHVKKSTVSTEVHAVQRHRLERRDDH